MPYALRSATVAALPIVNHVLSRLRFSEILSRYLPPADERTQLDPSITLTVFLKSLVLCRNPL